MAVCNAGDMSDIQKRMEVVNASKNENFYVVGICEMKKKWNAKNEENCVEGREV